MAFSSGVTPHGALGALQCRGLAGPLRAEHAPRLLSPFTGLLLIDDSATVRLLMDSCLVQRRRDVLNSCCPAPACLLLVPESESFLSGGVRATPTGAQGLVLALH